jgi:hypothetical protein
MLDTHDDTGHARNGAVITGTATEAPPAPYHDAFAAPSRSGPGNTLRRLVPKRLSGGGSGGRKGPVRADGEQSGTYDLRNSWQVAAGSILIPLGVIFILLAWYGAAHARVEQQQIPYLISGGFTGLGCMVVGGLLFFGHWLYRIYDQADLQHEEQLKALEQLTRAIAGTTHGSVVLPVEVEAETETSVGAADARGRYYATASGTVYHRADCAVIVNHPEDVRVLGSSGLAGLRPCQICSPPG